MRQQEERRDIPGYEGLYQIDKSGLVYSATGKQKSPVVHRTGFLGLTLFKDGQATYFLIHRLVAKVFLGMDDKNQVLHKDGDKQNNHVSNLVVRPFAPKPQRRPVDYAQRFWSKVKALGPNDCWEWMGPINNAGYGWMGYKGRNIGAHRFSYELHKGKIPTGMVVMHTCDNRRCCNPAHLRIGTHKDNSLDAVRKGRWRARGKSKRVNRA